MSGTEQAVQDPSDGSAYGLMCERKAIAIDPHDESIPETTRIAALMTIACTTSTMGEIADTGICLRRMECPVLNCGRLYLRLTYTNPETAGERGLRTDVGPAKDTNPCIQPD